MKRPIYYARINFKYRLLKNLRKVWKQGSIECFITTENLRELTSDDMVVGKICRSIKKKSNEIELIIKQTTVISQHGETNDRF